MLNDVGYAMLQQSGDLYVATLVDCGDLRGEFVMPDEGERRTRFACYLIVVRPKIVTHGGMLLPVNE